MPVLKCLNHEIGSHPKASAPAPCPEPVFAECDQCRVPLCSGHYDGHVRFAHPVGEASAPVATVIAAPVAEVAPPAAPAIEAPVAEASAPDAETSAPDAPESAE
jgi:hypothetical protein